MIVSVFAFFKPPFSLLDDSNRQHQICTQGNRGTVKQSSVSRAAQLCEHSEAPAFVHFASTLLLVETCRVGMFERVLFQVVDLHSWEIFADVIYTTKNTLVLTHLTFLEMISHSGFLLNENSGISTLERGQKPPPTPSGKLMTVKIQMLDDTQETFEVPDPFGTNSRVTL
ncbi:hypothetical protein STEG23_035538, partial [Scotinomys teguina]